MKPLAYLNAMLCVLFITATESPSWGQDFTVVDKGTSFLVKMDGEYIGFDNTLKQWVSYAAEATATLILVPISTSDIVQNETDSEKTTSAYWEETYTPMIKVHYVVHAPCGDIEGQYLSAMKMEYYTYASKYQPDYTYKWLDLETYPTGANTVDYTYSELQLMSYDGDFSRGGDAWIYISNDPTDDMRLYLWGEYGPEDIYMADQTVTGSASNMPFDQDMNKRSRATNPIYSYEAHAEALY